MKITNRDKRTNLDKEIDDVIEYLGLLQPGSDEYKTAVENLTKLCEVKTKTKKEIKIPWETIAVIGGNLLGIVLILNYEKADVIATKALGFVLRGRV